MVTKHKRTKWTPHKMAQLCELVSAGYNDREVAERMRASKQVVARLRRIRLGMDSPGNGSVGSRQRQSVVMSTRNRGVPSLVARCKAAHMGWPDASSAAHARVLNVLLQGPATVRRLSELLRLKCSTIRDHLQAIRSQGLVIPAGKQSSGTRPCIIWRLADGVGKHDQHVSDKKHAPRGK